MFASLNFSSLRLSSLFSPTRLRHKTKLPLLPQLDEVLVRLDGLVSNAFYRLPSNDRVMLHDGEWTYPEKWLIDGLRFVGARLERLRALNHLLGQRGEDLDGCLMESTAEVLHVPEMAVRAAYCLKAAACLALGRELDEKAHPKAWLDEVRGLAQWEFQGPFGEYQTHHWTELSVGPGLSNWWYRIFSDASN